jgi:hypothetical protein
VKVTLTREMTALLDLQPLPDKDAPGASASLVIAQPAPAMLAH